MATTEREDRAADRLDRFWDAFLGHPPDGPNGTGAVHPGGPPTPTEDRDPPSVARLVRSAAGPGPGSDGALAPDLPGRNGVGPEPFPDRVPALADAVRRLHARDDAPAPDPAFAARLRRDLFPPGVAATQAASASPADDATTPTPAPLVPGGRVLPFLHPIARRPLAELVAAALLLAVLGGSLGGRGLLPNLGGGSPPTVAAHAAAVPTFPALSCVASPTPYPGEAPAATPPLGTPSHRPCP